MGLQEQLAYIVPEFDPDQIDFCARHILTVGGRFPSAAESGEGVLRWRATEVRGYCNEILEQSGQRGFMRFETML